MNGADLARPDHGAVGVREPAARAAQLGAVEIAGNAANDATMKVKVGHQQVPELQIYHSGIKSDPPSVVVVYGHPEHRARCRRQFLATAFGAGWEFDPKSVFLGGQGVEVPVGGGTVALGSWAAKMWVADTAQLWCRSKRNWEDYESMGSLRLH